MRDSAFAIERDLFAPSAPFAHAHDPKRPGSWAVTDALGATVARARTRAGARAAVRALYAPKHPHLDRRAS